MPKRILLCDDEAHITRAAEIKLRRAGFDVRCASDGEEAWDIISQWLPDILVTDCQMPNLDGLGLVERLRQHEATQQLHILMLTAKGFELGHRELAEKWNVLGVFAKPFSPRELVRSIEEILATGKYRQAPAYA